MKRHMLISFVLVVMASLVLAACYPPAAPAPDKLPPAQAAAPEPPGIASLSEISIDGLRSRDFSSTLTIEQQLGDAQGSSEYSQFYGEPYYNTYMASYDSDGLRVYSRVDVPPGDMPAGGYPVIVFSHGWVGEEGAPGYKFNYAPEAYYGDMLDAYVKAGYVVLTPGFRGHGTVNEVPADGLEYIQAYDNGSYLSPIFYAIDILNLLAGVDSLNDVDWAAWGAGDVKVDTDRIYLTGHSQGGDAAFTALAVSSSPALENHFAAASIWSGSIEGRVEQGAFFGPQEASADAVTDPAYFPHMPSWWDPAWYWGTIADGNAAKKAEMYDTVRQFVADQTNADPETHSLIPAMAALDASKHPQYFDMPLDLHFSDMDHYSIPAWNEAAIRLIRAAGGTATAYLYPGNSHELNIDEGWSPADATPGRKTAIERTIELFDAAP